MQNNNAGNITKEQALENIYVCLAPAGTYPEEVTRNYLDLQMYIRIFLPENATNHGIASFAVRDLELANYLGGIDILFDVAKRNTREKAEITTFSQLMGLPAGSLPGTDIGIAKVNTAGKEVPTYGAGAFLFPELFAEYCEKNHVETCVICPSSVHEVICHPFDGRGADKATEIVQMVNGIDGCLSLNEVLGTHAYTYSTVTGEITY